MNAGTGPAGLASDAPGRSCPLDYRYRADALASAPDFAAPTIYVVGELYGNPFALDEVLRLAGTESRPVELVFNGDFNWFDVEGASFERINRAVLAHRALRGNVETELVRADDAAGCGCAYPEWVDDEVVRCSNAIIGRLRSTARSYPALGDALRRLPMHLVAAIGPARVGIVHGDAESLAGWSFSQEALAAPGGIERLRHHLRASGASVLASSHTCLPVLVETDRGVLVNNGAAGMPNFAGTSYGLLTRISVHPADEVETLHGTRADGVHVDAVPIRYDHAGWLATFERWWPPGSPAHRSYRTRIEAGPCYTPEEAVRGPARHPA